MEENRQGTEFLFDDLFVAGATYREPSAGERVALARREREEAIRAGHLERRARRRARQRGPLRSVALLVAAVVAVWLTGIGWGGGSENKGGAPDRVKVVYALPAGAAEDPGMADAVRTEVALAQGWFAAQTGHTLRLVGEGDEVAVETTELSSSASELSTRADAASVIAEDLRGDDEGQTDEVTLAFVPVVFSDLVRCGTFSERSVAVVFVGSCGAEPSVDSDAFGDGTTVAIAHELVHALGAVADCAPHQGRNGHTTDDPTDLMFDGAAGGSAPELLVLDPGRDDYYGTGRSGCPDVADHPAWN